MMKFNLLLILFITQILFTGCKTQSQIRREQHMENLTMQVSESQQMTADTTIRLSNIEERLNHLHGALEEKGYAEQIKRQESLSEIEQKIAQLERTTQDLSRQMAQTHKQLQDQKAYLDQVISTMRQISENTGGLKKKSIKQLYDTAVGLYRQAQYERSRLYFSELLTRNPDGQILSHAYHNMGMIEHIAGRDNEAIIFFGRLFTEFPDSGYNRNGLLFLAKTFERQGQLTEARQTLQQLIQRFPEANQVAQARAILQRIN